MPFLNRRRNFNTPIAVAVQRLFESGEQGAYFSAYNPNTVVPRRNLLTYTNDITNAVWTKSGAGTGVAPIVTGGFTAPDGTNTACRVVINRGVGVTGSDMSLVQNNVGGLSVQALAGTFVSSVYLKSNTGSTQNVMLWFPNAAFSAVVPIGTAWQRVALPSAILNGSVPLAFVIGSRGNAGGDINQDILVWGAQVEYGTTPTAYQAVTDWNTEYIAAGLECIGMWQDATGTTPVTAVEQPVGMWLDGRGGKSWVRGPSVLLNGGFDTSAAWTNASSGTGSATISGGVATIARVNSTNKGSLTQVLTLNANSNYEVTGFVTGAAGFCSLSSAGGNFPVGSFRFFSRTTTASNTLFIEAVSDGTTAVFDNITVREVPGNHATQATASARPVLSARYNLLTKTEQLSDAVWTKVAATATDSALTASNTTFSKLVPDTTSAFHGAVQQITAVAPAYIHRVRLKSAGLQYAYVGFWSVATFTGGWGSGSARAAVFDLNAGTIVSGSDSGVDLQPTIVNLGNGVYEVTVRATVAAGALQGTVHAADNAARTAFTGDGVNGIYVSQADIRVLDSTLPTMPGYQRVNTATDYDTAGFPHYLRFDGVDDRLTTTAFAGTGPHHTMMTAFRHLGGGINFASVMQWFTGPHQVAMGRADATSALHNRLDTDTTGAGFNQGADPASGSPFDGGSHVSRFTVDRQRRAQVDTNAEFSAPTNLSSDFGTETGTLYIGCDSGTRFANVALYGAAYVRSVPTPGSFDNYRKTLAKLAGMA